jgi:hypothetical protein
MKTYIAQTSSTETADTYSVWSKSARGIEWKKGPFKKIELAASGRGTPAFWNSPAGKFIASGLQFIAAPTVKLSGFTGFKSARAAKAHARHVCGVA